VATDRTDLGVCVESVDDGDDRCGIDRVVDARVPHKLRQAERRVVDVSAAGEDAPLSVRDLHVPPALRCIAEERHRGMTLSDEAGGQAADGGPVVDISLAGGSGEADGFAGAATAGGRKASTARPSALSTAPWCLWVERPPGRLGRGSALVPDRRVHPAAGELAI
jgi:hypothetical protein